MAKKGAFISLLESIIPDLRTAGWNRAKWAPLPIVASALLSFPLGWFLSDGKITSGTALIWVGTLSVSAPIFMLITRTIIWVLVVNPAEQKRAVIKQTKKRQVARPTSVDTFFENQRRITPKDFEHEVAGVFEAVYNLQANVVGGSGDGGIDIELFDRTGTRVGIVQVKQYSKTVPPSALRDLDSCRRRSGVRKAFLVTSGKFSKTTHQQAQEMKIDLVDGEKYAELKKKAQEKSVAKAGY